MPGSFLFKLHLLKNSPIFARNRRQVDISVQLLINNKYPVSFISVSKVVPSGHTTTHAGCTLLMKVFMTFGAKTVLVERAGRAPVRPVVGVYADDRMQALFVLLLFLTTFTFTPIGEARAQQVIDLTLETAVDLAMENSYRVKQLQIGIEQTRKYLEAERAGLKSRVYMELRTPQIAALSDQKWNADLHRNETIRENTRMWQMDFSIRQPVILFGYPTNGYLSLNNQMYRYDQLNGGRVTNYYNRYFIRFEQPLFQPNHLKNNLKGAELRLNEAELNFQEDVVNLMDSIADDYYDLFEHAYRQVIQRTLVDQLSEAEQVARRIVERDSTREIELSQVQVELTNAREQLKQSESNFRLEASRIKQRLRLNERDSLIVRPVLEVVPIEVDVDQAIEYGKNLHPRLQKLEITRDREQIDLENTKGWGGFRANLELTYGREMEEPRMADLWDEPVNSYSVALRAHVPIWDWGQRKARIQAEMLSLERVELNWQQAEQEIESEIINAVKNLEEYESRALAMRVNLRLAEQISEQSLDRYEGGIVSVLDLLQSFRRQADTAENFLDAYLGYRQAILRIQQLTYFDFENNQPLLNRFNGWNYMPQ